MFEVKRMPVGMEKRTVRVSRAALIGLLVDGDDPKIRNALNPLVSELMFG